MRHRNNFSDKSQGINYDLRMTNDDLRMKNRTTEDTEGAERKRESIHRPKGQGRRGDFRDVACNVCTIINYNYSMNMIW